MGLGVEDDLANYANSQCRKYIPDKDIMESFLENSPVPENIAKTLRLDHNGVLPQRQRGICNNRKG